jgi:hypothetical protein
LHCCPRCYWIRRWMHCFPRCYWIRRWMYCFPRRYWLRRWLHCRVNHLRSEPCGGCTGRTSTARTIIRLFYSRTSLHETRTSLAWHHQYCQGLFPIPHVTLLLTNINGYSKTPTRFLRHGRWMFSRRLENLGNSCH